MNYEAFRCRVSQYYGFGSGTIYTGWVFDEHHGGKTGMDTLAEAYARSQGIPVTVIRV